MEETRERKARQYIKLGLTGISGGLGKRMAEMLLADNFKIKALVRETANIDAISKKVTFIRGDLHDENSLRRFVENIDICVHLAAQVGFATKRRYLETNTTGTKNLCRAILTYNPKCRLIYCSTISTLKVNPLFKFLSSPYAVSKYYAEKIITRHMERNDLNATIIYPGLIYGGYDRSFFPQIIKALEKGRIRLVKGGENSAPLIYVDELCDLFIRTITHAGAAGKRYIAVRGLEIGIHDVIMIMAQKLHYHVSKKKYPRRILFLLGFIIEKFFQIFRINKQPIISRTAVDILSINFKNYTKKYDDPQKDLHWRQNTSKQFIIAKIDEILN